MNNIIKIEAQKSLRTEIITSNGYQITNDGIVGDGGYGDFLSPLDMMAASIGSCILTTMGIIASRNDFDISGTKMEISKTSSKPPNAMITAIDIKIIFPEEMIEKLFMKLKRAITACPAKNSLHPDIKINVEYHFLNTINIIKEEI